MLNTNVGKQGATMNKAPKKERNRGMYEALLTMQTVDEMMKFFDDLCTVTEIVAMEQRFQVAVCLSKGIPALVLPGNGS